MAIRASRGCYWLAYANASLTYREHHYREALVLLDRFLGSQQAGEHVQPPRQAYFIFTRAVLNAELDQTDEARRDFDRARAQLKLSLGDKPGHDRGKSCGITYQAEIRQREAEATFKAKGIPLPEPDAK